MDFSFVVLHMIRLNRLGKVFLGMGFNMLGLSLVVRKVWFNVAEYVVGLANSV
jgi:hypothetical protein